MGASVLAVIPMLDGNTPGMVPIINVSGWITKRCASKVSWCVEQSGIPLRQSSEPLWAFPQMCAAFIKLGCVIAQTAHLHPYFANTWNLKRCCPGLVFAVVLPGACPPVSANGMSALGANRYLGSSLPKRIKNCLFSSSKSTTQPSRMDRLAALAVPGK